MEHTLVAVFDTESQAQNALDDLASSGLSRGDMDINASQHTGMTGSTSAPVGEAVHEPQSIGERISAFFRNMFGSDDTAHADIYSEAARRGGYVLTVLARDDDQITLATEVLERHHPINLEERTAEWRSTGWMGASAADTTMGRSPATGTEPAAGHGVTSAGTPLQEEKPAAQPQAGGESQRIPVVEEQLQVGKREVQRGGVRVFQRVTEEPAQESVQLREENVKVERHPVDQPASPADMAAFKEGTIEMRGTAEEPVVAKTARVVEEVVLGKEVRDRTENINDTVRRTDVEVEQLGAQPGMAGSGTAADDSEFRTHWQSSYAQTGGRYEDYAPAYQYGSTLGADERYRGRRWDEIEPQVRTDWESSHADSPWEKTKEAVRVGWEKMTR